MDPIRYHRNPVLNFLQRWTPKKRAKVFEGTNSMQLVCPYCNEIQKRSHGGHVQVNPPDYYTCEVCNLVMAVKKKW